MEPLDGTEIALSITTMRILYIITMLLFPMSTFAQELLRDGSAYAGIGMVGEVKKSDFYGYIKDEVHPVMQIGLQEYRLDRSKEITGQTIVSLQMHHLDFGGFDNYGSGTYFFDFPKIKKMYFGAGIRGALHISPNPNAISTDPYTDSAVLAASSQSAAQIEIGYRDYDPKRIRMIAPVFGIKSIQNEKLKYQLGARSRLSMDESILLLETIYSKNFDTCQIHDFSAYLGVMVNVNKYFKKLKLPFDVYAGLDARISNAYLKTESKDVVRTTKSNVGTRVLVTFK